MADEELRTPVWMLSGLTGSVPGLLEMVDGKVGFTTEEQRVFESPLTDISVKYPWYYFGGGCKIRIKDDVYRISFVRPNGASDLPGEVLARVDDGAGGALSLLTAGRKLHDIGQGRRAGKAWKAALGSRIA